jgi:hypothetical protein
MSSARTHRILALAAGLVLALSTAAGAAAAPGPPTSYMSTVHAARGGGKPGGGGGGSVNLKYNGGTGGTGVVTGAGKVYVVVWGSQWGADPASDPEVLLLESFYGDVGGSLWNNSVTQYCQGVKKGTVSCNGAGTSASNMAGMFDASQIWFDTGSRAPSRPGQSQIAAEAAAAADYFGIDPAASQVVVLTASGNSMTGFGTQWCAWHSWTSSTVGTIGYTYLPYITDAGWKCGAGFNGMGADAGVTMVGGHELAETETDIYPSSGWTDGNGAENGDKCAWSTDSQAVVLQPANQGGDNASYPVQPLWSNAFNSGAGGCVLSY